MVGGVQLMSTGLIGDILLAESIKCVEKTFVYY
jgi:hypothetical protein